PGAEPGEQADLPRRRDPQDEGAEAVRPAAGPGGGDGEPLALGQDPFDRGDDRVPLSIGGEVREDRPDLVGGRGNGDGVLDAAVLTHRPDAVGGDRDDDQRDDDECQGPNLCLCACRRPLPGQPPRSHSWTVPSSEPVIGIVYPSIVAVAAAVIVAPEPSVRLPAASPPPTGWSSAVSEPP